MIEVMTWISAHSRDPDYFWQ